MNSVKSAPRPVISVIIPCFNGNRTLGFQLEALARQQDAPMFEVIVVDNRSTEPPDVVVDNWRSRIPLLRIVRAVEAQGISVARNVGVREAACDKVAICDADDCAGPHFVRAAVEGLRSAKFVTGNVVSVDAREFGRGVDHVWSLLPDRDPYDPLDMDAVDPNYPIMMGGACAFYREAVLRLDGYDQAYFPGVEDNDFALRVVRSGERIGRAYGMTLAERRRATSGGTYKRSYDAGRMHMKLCAGHALWKTSPHLHHPSWWIDLAKIPLFVARDRLRPPAERDPLSVSGRVGLRVGQAVGFVQYRVLRRSTRSRTGVGLR